MDRDSELKVFFAEIMRGKLSLFRKISVRIVNSYADADDAVQAALIKAWDRRKKFRGQPDVLTAWLIRIIVSESYNILRKRIREQRKREGLSRTEPEQESRGNPLLDDLDRAIAELPELYRKTIHIAVLGELSGEDAAQVLGCSANTLYQRIYKAKQLLLTSIRRFRNE